MSTQSTAIELQVAAIQSIWAAAEIEGRGPSLREQHAINRHFSALQDLLSARVSYLVSRYRLGDLQADAEQACAIGIHRALKTYEPAKASFSTHVTWQMRGELQRLRHRMRLDQRQSARKAGVVTSSLEEMGGADEAPLQIVDDSASQRAEEGAATRMATRLCDRLFDDYVRSQNNGRIPTRPGTLSPDQVDAVAEKLAREKQIVTNHFLDRDDDRGDAALSAEQKRQILRRVLRQFDKQLHTQPRYAMAVQTVH